MTRGISAVGMFCEDIREEVGGTHTIVGTMPDNMVVPSIPIALPKLGVYVRIQFPVGVDPGAISLKLTRPDQPDVSMGGVDEAFVKKALRDAAEKGLPIVGVISRAIFPHFQITAEGQTRAIATIDGEEIICAVLSIKTAEIKAP